MHRRNASFWFLPIVFAVLLGSLNAAAMTTGGGEAKTKQGTILERLVEQREGAACGAEAASNDRQVVRRNDVEAAETHAWLCRPLRPEDCSG